MPMIERIKERFLAKTVRNLQTGCLEWQASKFWDGYGQFRWDAERPNMKAHRAAWEIQWGPIPQGMQVLHNCDTPGCVEVSHMFLGTHQDNVSDKIRKGRHKDRFGRPSANLTDEEMDRIRMLGPHETQARIGELFGVSQDTVWTILHGKGRKTAKMVDEGSPFTGTLRDKVTPEMRAQIVHLRQSLGMTQTTIAEQVGIDQTTVSRVLKAAKQQESI